MAEEEPGAAQSVSILLQPSWSQGRRSHLCSHGASVPPAGEPAGMHAPLYICHYICLFFISTKQFTEKANSPFLSYSVGDHSEAAAVPFASAYYTAPVICLHCLHQDGHSQPCSPPQQSHTRHPLHHHTHGDPTTSGHHGRSGQYFKKKSLT